MARNKDQFEQLKHNGYLGEEIITGEGVALELPSATAASRFVSGGIDWFINLIFLLTTIILIVRNSEKLSFATIDASVTVALAVWIFLVPSLITGLSHGRSVGKLITGTRIVRGDGGVITMRHALIRSTVGIVEIWVTQGIVAFFAVVLSKRSQRLGDMLAGTYVVRWPHKTNYERTLTIPQSLDTWAQAARTREIPGGLTLNIANHFKTSPTLTPQARAEEARVLAAAAEKYVSPAPPWGTPPEDFLAAVLVLRNNVEYTRTSTSRERQDRILATLNRLPYHT